MESLRAVSAGVHLLLGRLVMVRLGQHVFEESQVTWFGVFLFLVLFSSPGRAGRGGILLLGIGDTHMTFSTDYRCLVCLLLLSWSETMLCPEGGIVQ